ncbi:IS110 family transposase [Halalkalibacter okhensis]|uniref:IS110 family transposase n=1 Tax=Halalkalibacter okhensis TaxID=333138 RepID=UPI000AD65B8E|nr:IS110 family transposase [Halalkalibacter okhensis]
MAYSLFKHIQGKKGSRWAEFVRETGTENLMLVAIDAAKFTQKALICTFYGDILVKPFEFDASLTGFEYLKRIIQSEKDKYKFTEVVVGIETTGHYYEDLVRRCHADGYHVRTLNAATTAEERKALLNWSKTDNLDLMVIVQSMINGRGTSNVGRRDRSLDPSPKETIPF